MKTPGFLRRRLQQEARPSPVTIESCPQVFTEVLSDPFVRGFLHKPTNSNGNGLVLTHGAGSNCQAPLLIAMADAFCGAGYFVLRCDLPFRQDRPYGPPGPIDGKRDRAGLKNAVAALKDIGKGRVFLGGHSYGGRQASILCAEEPEQASGLLLLSYPLHPPHKPEQLRTQHFFNLHTPTLFVQGTHDPFGSIAEMENAIKLVQGKAKLIPIEGAGHDLGFKSKRGKIELSDTVLGNFREFFS
jgi:uncharacterized protein